MNFRMQEPIYVPTLEFGPVEKQKQIDDVTFVPPSWTK